MVGELIFVVEELGFFGSYVCGDELLVWVYRSFVLWHNPREG